MKSYEGGDSEETIQALLEEHDRLVAEEAALRLEREQLQAALARLAEQKQHKRKRRGKAGRRR